METFDWPYRRSPKGEVTFNTEQAKFKDGGYSQETSIGLNPRSEAWPLEFFGTEQELAPVKDFLDRHGSWKRFLWTPPMGSEGRFKVTLDGYQLVQLGGGWYTIAVKFESRG